MNEQGGPFVSLIRRNNNNEKVSNVGITIRCNGV